MIDPTDASAMSQICGTGVRCPVCHAHLDPGAIACQQCGAPCEREPFVQSWKQATGLPQQKFDWMCQMLDLWVGLGAFACQASVLMLDNLSVDARSVVCIERVIRDLPSLARFRPHSVASSRTTSASAPLLPLKLPPKPTSRISPVADRANDALTKAPSDLHALIHVWQSLDEKFPDAHPTVGAMLAEVGRLPNPSVERLRHIFDKYAHGHQASLAESPARSTAMTHTDPEDEGDPTLILADMVPRAGKAAEHVDPADSASAADIASDRRGELPPLRVDRAARTDIGRQRSRNEDTFAIWERRDRLGFPDGDRESLRGLYVLCDGMGGHAGGNLASQLAAQTAVEFFQSHWRSGLPDPAMLRDGIFAANRAVYAANQSNQAEGARRMGTTFIGLWLSDSHAAIANVGDSRVYRYTHRHGLEQLTTDNDVANALIQNGTPESIAYRHPNAHQLTQAIGPYDESTLDPDLFEVEIREDTLFLLASDGLTDRELLAQPDVPSLAAMLDPNTDLDRAADDLIAFANRENGHDNITAILVRVLVSAPMGLRSR